MTNSFNYLRAPENDDEFEKNYQRETKGLASRLASNQEDLANQVKNQQGESSEKLLEGLKTFSTNINELLLQKHKKSEEDALHKAQLNVRAGYHDESQNQQLLDAQLQQDGISKTINTAGAELKQQQGKSSILAQELYARDPYYEAAVNQLLIQERAGETGQRLLAAQETLTIAGVDGEELTYAEIIKPSDMAAWTAKFEAQDIRDNFRDVTAEGFSLFANETYGNTITQHGNQWTLNNAESQEKARLQLEGNVIMQSFNDGEGKFTEAAQKSLYTKRLTPSQLYDLVLTGIESGAVSQDTMNQFQNEVPHTGGGTTNLAELIGLQNFAKLETAFQARKKTQYTERLAENEVRVNEAIAEIRLSLIKDPDGVSKAKLTQIRDRLIRENNGHEIPEFDQLIEEYSAENIAKNNAANYDLERDKKNIRLGLYDRSELKGKPESVRIQLENYMAQYPDYNLKNGRHQAHIKDAENLVDIKAKNTPNGIKAKGTNTVKNLLRTRYISEIQNGVEPAKAYKNTEEYFNTLMAKDGYFDETKGEGFVGAVISDTDSKKYVAEMNRKKEKAKDNWFNEHKEDKELAIQTKNAYFSDTELRKKVAELNLGRATYSEYERYVADILGYSHPAKMFQEILEKNPVVVNGVTLEYNSPEILQYAENIQPAGQAILFDDILKNGIKGFQRTIASNPQVTGLPVKGAADYSLAENISEGWGRMSRVIRFAEGTATGRGYNTMFTGSQFSEFGWHPRQINTSGRYRSDAAGAYQFLSTTWDGAANALGLKDFSPESQEKAGRYLTQQRQVNPDQVYKTKEEFAQALAKLSPEWASLPNQYGVSYHGQPVKKLDELWEIYNQ